MHNLSSLLEDSAASYGDREAVVLGDTRLAYAQVDGAANQVANLLVSRGIEPGDKVALSCPNLPNSSRSTATASSRPRRPWCRSTCSSASAWSTSSTSYKYPRIVELVDQLPMTATGKILKRELS